MIFLYMNLSVSRRDVDFARHANLCLANEFDAKIEDEEHGNIDVRRDKFLEVEFSNKDRESIEITTMTRSENAAHVR